MAAFFREYRLNKELRKYIDCVWFEDFTQQKSQFSNTHLVIPDNTIELVFTENLFERELTGEKIKFGSHLCGLKTLPQKIRLAGPVILAVRFKPEGLYPFIKENSSDLVDKSINPEILFGNEIINLQHKIASAHSELKKVQIVDSFFNQLLIKSKKKTDPFFDLFLKRIESSKGQLLLKNLANEFMVSQKTIQRKFLEYLGITPKKYLRLVRLIETIKSFETNSLNQFSHLVYQHGYYDQMHFIKEIKAFTGKKPTEYFNHYNKGIQQAVFGH